MMHEGKIERQVYLFRDKNFDESYLLNVHGAVFVTVMSSKRASYSPKLTPRIISLSNGNEQMVFI